MQAVRPFVRVKIMNPARQADARTRDAVGITSDQRAHMAERIREIGRGVGMSQNQRMVDPVQAQVLDDAAKRQHARAQPSRL